MNFIFSNNVRILCLSCNVKKSENLSDLNKKDRNKRHSSPFINVVKVEHFIRIVQKFIRLVRIKHKFIRIAYLYSKCTDCRINNHTMYLSRWIRSWIKHIFYINIWTFIPTVLQLDFERTIFFYLSSAGLKTTPLIHWRH